MLTAATRRSSWFISRTWPTSRDALTRGVARERAARPAARAGTRRSRRGDPRGGARRGAGCTPPSPGLSQAVARAGDLRDRRRADRARAARRRSRAHGVRGRAWNLDGAHLAAAARDRSPRGRARRSLESTTRARGRRSRARGARGGARRRRRGRTALAALCARGRTGGRRRVLRAGAFRTAAEARAAGAIARREQHPSDDSHRRRCARGSARRSVARSSLRSDGRVLARCGVVPRFRRGDRISRESPAGAVPRRDRTNPSPR